MKEFELRTKVLEWDNAAELDELAQSLLRAAEGVIDDAYAPYSEFHVAAAVRLDSGEIVTGTNQENAAYPSGLCAERVALFSAASQLKGKQITDIAIIAKSKEFELDHPVAPCGACRQVMLEFRLRQEKSIRVILRGSKGNLYTLSDIQGLLPLFFHEEGLKKGH